MNVFPFQCVKYQYLTMEMVVFRCRYCAGPQARSLISSPSEMLFLEDAEKTPSAGIQVRCGQVALWGALGL